MLPVPVSSLPLALQSFLASCSGLPQRIVRPPAIVMLTDPPLPSFHSYTMSRHAIRARLFTAFGDAGAAVRTVLYPCSSADIMTPYLLFPDADRYILLDRQPAMKPQRMRRGWLHGLPTSQWLDWPYLYHGGEEVQGRLVEALIGGLAGLSTMYPQLTLEQASLFRDVRAPEAASWLWFVGAENGQTITHSHMVDPVHAWLSFSTQPGRQQHVLYISTPIARDGGILPCLQSWFDTLTPGALIFCAPQLFEGEIAVQRRVVSRFIGTMRGGGIAVLDDKDLFTLPEHLAMQAQSLPSLPSPGMEVEAYYSARFGYGVGAALYLLAPVPTPA